MAYDIVTRDTIPHYYGDKVRMLFIATAALSFISIPLWGHLVRLGTLFEVVSGIILIALAGLTNPRSRWVMVLNVIAAGLGAFLLEATAISFRMHDSLEVLIARETGAVLLVGALYFSVKTLRSMAQGKIGQWPTPWEFDKPTDGHEAP